MHFYMSKAVAEASCCCPFQTIMRQAGEWAAEPKYFKTLQPKQWVVWVKTTRSCERTGFPEERFLPVTNERVDTLTTWKQCIQMNCGGTNRSKQQTNLSLNTHHGYEISVLARWPNKELVLYYHKVWQAKYCEPDNWFTRFYIQEIVLAQYQLEFWLKHKNFYGKSIWLNDGSSHYSQPQDEPQTYHLLLTNTIKPKDCTQTLPLLAQYE